MNAIRLVVTAVLAGIASGAFAGVDKARMEWFKDQKLALMMHFGLYAEVGIIESWPLSDADAHWSRTEVERMREMGAWLAKFGDAIYATRPAAPYRKGRWAFTRGKDGTRYAIRLWSPNSAATTLFIPRDDAFKSLKSVRHFASGRTCPVRTIENPALGEYGVAFEFPEGVARDAYADVFVLVESGR